MSPASTRDIYAPHGSIFLPPDAVRLPLKSAEIREAALDVFKVFAAFLFVLLTGLSLTAGLFLLLFVET